MDQAGEPARHGAPGLPGRLVESAGEPPDRSNEELRAFAARFARIQEEERRSIARELHDDIAQRLALVNIEMEQVQRALPPSAQVLAPVLKRMQATLEGVSDDLRTLSHRLHPSILDDLGLEAALRSLVADFRQDHDLAVDFRCDGPTRAVPAPVATTVYRIAQESLRNAAQYAPDAAISVTLTGGGQALELSIQDDGPGFDLAVRSTGGLGILDMRERAHWAGGQFLIRSAPGQGTEVRLTIPTS